jgi:DNA-binding NarL/FixJ family response regulator
MKKHRILIVDDHEVVIEGIKSLLNDGINFEVIGEAQNGRDGSEKALALKPDIIIMDLFMPGLNGLESIKLIKNHSPMIKIVVYTMYSDSTTVLELFKQGISAYVLKDGPISDLLIALDAVKRDATFFRTIAPQFVADHLHKQSESLSSLDRLSPREKEIFELLIEGKSIKIISDRLCLSRKTVETHKYHLMEKLKIHNIVELTRFAMNRKA